MKDQIGKIASKPFKCKTIQHAQIYQSYPQNTVIISLIISLNRFGKIATQVPGLPGDDYPVFSSPPETSFVCDVQPVEGYYADQEVSDCEDPEVSTPIVIFPISGRLPALPCLLPCRRRSVHQVRLPLPQRDNLQPGETS